MAGLKNKKYKIKETRFITIDGNVFKLSGREIYDEDGQITGVKCQFCEFEGNPLGANYCGGCGRNITVNNHIWKVYDSTSYSTFSNYGNRVVSEVKLKEYERYEKIVKTTERYIRGGLFALYSLGSIVLVVIVWFFPELFDEVPIYNQGIGMLILVIGATIAFLIFAVVFGWLTISTIKEES